MKISIVLALLALSGCTVGLGMGQMPVSNITLPTCPKGTKVSGEIQAGGGFGGAVGFSARFDCNGGTAAP